MSDLEIFFLTFDTAYRDELGHTCTRKGPSTKQSDQQSDKCGTFLTVSKILLR